MVSKVNTFLKATLQVDSQESRLFWVKIDAQNLEDKNRGDMRISGLWARKSWLRPCLYEKISGYKKISSFKDSLPSLSGIFFKQKEFNRRS